MKGFNLMSFLPSTFAVLNFAVFAGIVIATLFVGVGDNVWTVVLAILGAVLNALAWRKFSNPSVALDDGKKFEEVDERERLMEDLSEEAKRRRERDRIERN